MKVELKTKPAAVNADDRVLHCYSTGGRMEIRPGDLSLCRASRWSGKATDGDVFAPRNACEVCLRLNGGL